MTQREAVENDDIWKQNVINLNGEKIAKMNKIHLANKVEQ